MKICDRRWMTTLRLTMTVSFCVLIAGCGGEPTPEVVAGIDGCASCGMVIDRVNEAAGWIEGGDFVPFCSPGCLLAEHDALRKSGQAPPQAVISSPTTVTGPLRPQSRPPSSSPTTCRR